MTTYGEVQAMLSDVERELPGDIEFIRDEGAKSVCPTCWRHFPDGMNADQMFFAAEVRLRRHPSKWQDSDLNWVKVELWGKDGIEAMRSSLLEAIGEIGDPFDSPSKYHPYPQHRPQG